MILLLALGIANIFTFDVIIIIFCAFALFVPTQLPLFPLPTRYEILT